MRTIRRLIEAIAKGYGINELVENPELYAPLAIHLDELKSTNYFRESPILISYQSAKSRVSGGERLKEFTLKRRLTKLEERIIKLFLMKKGLIVSREDGIKNLWGDDGVSISDHAYDQIIHRLRSKINDSIPRVNIETVRGRGHVLNVVDSEIH
jgi:DNA-binding response OmpR family regulator